MAVDLNVIEEFVGALQSTPENTNSVYSATVSRIDDEGTVWVYVAGSNKETPTASASSEVKRGDYVNVEFRNNKLYISGNYSNPSAGVIRVQAVERQTLDALQDSVTAKAAAESAVESAGVAGRAASVAQAAADAAAELANTKKTVFVTQPTPPYHVGDLWARLGADLEDFVDENGNNLVDDQGALFQAAILRDAAAWVCLVPKLEGQEFSEDDWALTTADTNLREWFWHDALGAHVLGDETGYRNDITSTGMKIMDVSTETSVAEFGSSGAQIGQDDTAHSIINADGQRFYANDGIKTFEVVSSGVQKTVTKYIRAYVYPNTVSSYELNPVPETGGTITLTGGISLDTVWSGTYGTAYSGTAQEPLGGLLYTINYDGATSLSISAQTSSASGCFISYPFVMYTPVYSLGTRADDDDAGGFSTAIGEGLYASSENQTVIGKYNQKDTSDDYALVVGIGSGENSRSDGLEFDWSGNLWIRNNIKAEGSITVGGHSSPIGTILEKEWKISSSSASGTDCTDDISLTAGTWMLGMITPTCSATIAYYFKNLSSTLHYPYFNLGTGGSGWVPVTISSTTSVSIRTGASASVTYSNTERGRILAVRIA